MVIVRSLLTLLLTCALCGCQSTRHAQTPTGPHLRMVTYNVNYGSSPSEVAEVIRTLNADIVCLQEAGNLEQTLRPILKNTYPTIKFFDSASGRGGENAILSKFPIRKAEWIPSETYWFGASVTTLETPLGPVQMLNVHLRPPFSERSGWVGGYFSTGGFRFRELQRFYQHCDPNIPILVAGDFNDTKNSRPARFLKNRGFKNALPQFDRRTPTWEWQTRLVKLHRRMDHIFYSDQLDCASARVIRAGPSDHFPVEAEAVIITKSPSAK